jgi:hypothetical protein
MTGITALSWAALVLGFVCVAAVYLGFSPIAGV